MKCFITLFNTTILTFSLLGLAACDSDDPANDDPANDDPAQGETPIEVGTPTQGETPTSGGNADLTSATPLYLTSACGTLPVSDAPYSNSATAPTPVTVGQVVAGRVDPQSAGNTEHYWSIDLQAGFYHMIFDITRVDDRYSNLGMRVTDLFGAGEDDDVRLLAGNYVGYRIREYKYIEIPAARTMTIRATSGFSAVDYTFAIVGNGSEVPSPYLNDCPTINTMSLDTTVSLTLPGASSFADEQWYQVELETGDYVLDSSATRTDGRFSNIIYKLGYVDQFAQSSRYECVICPNHVGTSTTASGALRRSEAGPVWIKLENRNAELGMEFTLQEDN